MANNFRRILLTATVVMAVVPMMAGKYQNFKVSTYIRAQDIARMEDEQFLKSTWETVSSQVDLDKIYLETHRDAYTVPDHAQGEEVLPLQRSGGGGRHHLYTL